MDLRQFINRIDDQNLNLEGIMVSQYGKILAAHRWVPEIRKNVYSVSKGFTSIAIGMAVDEGILKLDSKLADFFPLQNPPPRLASVEVKHLLTMTRGNDKFTRPKNTEEALSYELVYNPGEKFVYDNASSFLLSAVFTRATGQKLRDYLLDRLFRPLEIPDPEWEENEEGYNIGASGLRINTSDMERFGQFLLNRGNWNGRQLVSASWIDGATRTQVDTKPLGKLDDWDIGYGWQFWTCRNGAFRSDGKKGQFIIVIPWLNAVIAVSSNEKNMEPVLWTVWETVLPLLE